MFRKSVAILSSASLITGPAAAQFTINIPGVTNSRSGLHVRPQVVVPLVDGRRQLPPPGQSSGYNGNTARLDENRRVQVARWEQAADKGDLTAAYHVGRAFEMGTVSYPSRAPDMAQAVEWYNRAVRGGNLNAMYHLGALMVTRNVLAVDQSGTARPDVQGGRKMMDYAVQHGYQPATDTVRTETASNDNSAGVLAGSLAALIIMGALASSGSAGDTSSPPESDFPPRDPHLDKICTIEEPTGEMNPYYHDDPITRTRQGVGYECP